jgi:hypothetical protein
VSNDLKVSSFILNEVMRQMEINLQFTKNCSRGDVEGRFTESPKKGETIKGRKDVRYVGRDGETFTDEGVIQRTFDITVQQTAGVDVLLTNRDLMFNVDNLTENIAKPAAETLASKIDTAALAIALSSVANSVGVPGTVPTDLKTYNKARALLSWEGAPQGGHSMLITPDMQVEAVDAGKLFFTQEAEDQYETGMLGRHSGAKVYECQNLPTHIVGPLGGTPQVDGANQTGSTILTKGWTNGTASRLKKDDIVTFAGCYAVNPTTRQSTGALRQFTVTANFSDTAGAGTISISPAIVTSGPYQNVTASPDDSGALLTYATVSSIQNKVSPQGLRFHKEAFVFGTLDQPSPEKAVIFAKSISHPRLPLKIRYIADWDTKANKRIDRLDVVWYFGVAVPEWACRIAS